MAKNDYSVKYANIIHRHDLVSIGGIFVNILLKVNKSTVLSPFADNDIVYNDNKDNVEVFKSLFTRISYLENHKPHIPHYL